MSGRSAPGHREPFNYPQPDKSPAMMMGEISSPVPALGRTVIFRKAPPGLPPVTPTSATAVFSTISPA